MMAQIQAKAKAAANQAKAQGPGMMAQLQAKAKAAANQAKAAAPGMMAQVKAAANQAKAAAPGMMAQAKGVVNKAKAAAPGMMAQAKGNVKNNKTAAAPGAVVNKGNVKNNKGKIVNVMKGSNIRARYKGRAIADKVQAGGRKMAENTTTQTLTAIDKGRNMARTAHRQAMNMAQQAHNQALAKARQAAQADGLQFGGGGMFGGGGGGGGQLGQLLAEPGMGGGAPMNYMDTQGRRIMEGPNGGAFVNMPGGTRNYRPNAAFRNQVGSGMVTPVSGQGGLPQNLRY